ncbi:MAG: hypothetical protein HUJ68_11425 [Clostridia bacterium]|nr:hypothetical protein [Clostridia bacterium]
MSETFGIVLKATKAGIYKVGDVVFNNVEPGMYWMGHHKFTKSLVTAKKYKSLKIAKKALNFKVWKGYDEGWVNCGFEEKFGIQYVEVEIREIGEAHSN